MMSIIGVSISVSINGAKKGSSSPSVLNNIKSELNMDIISESGVDLISE